MPSERGAWSFTNMLLMEVNAGAGLPLKTSSCLSGREVDSQYMQVACVKEEKKQVMHILWLFLSTLLDRCEDGEREIEKFVTTPS